jgi:hypothetical protein
MMLRFVLRIEEEPQDPLNIGGQQSVDGGEVVLDMNMSRYNQPTRFHWAKINIHTDGPRSPYECFNLMMPPQLLIRTADQTIGKKSLMKNLFLCREISLNEREYREVVFLLSRNI